MSKLERNHKLSFHTYGERMNTKRPMNFHIFRAGLNLLNVSDSDYEDISSIFSELIDVTSGEDNLPTEKFKISTSGGLSLHTSSGVVIKLVKKMNHIKETMLFEAGLSSEEAKEFTLDSRNFLSGANAG